ncbi:MAG: hypothetical protein AAGA57_10955 [Planctomycetota bacterium]
MMPTITQRLMLAAAALIGLWFAALAGGPLRLSSGSTGLVMGLSLHGPGVAWLVLAGLTVAVWPLAWWVSSTGSVLSGPTVLAVAYLGLRASVGPLDPLLWRDAPAGLFGRWALEGLGWTALIALATLAGAAGRPWLRPRTPRKLRSPTCDPGSALKLGAVRGWLALGAMAPAGVLIAAVLVRTPTTGQTWAGLLVAYALVAALMQAGARSPNVAPMLLAPTLGLSLAHAWAWARYGSWTAPELLADVHAGHAPAILWASPADAAGAGLLGACLGLGLAHVALAPPRHRRDPA